MTSNSFRISSRKLNWAERWVRDGLELAKPPAFFETLQVDMTNARALIDRAREHGVRITYGAVLTRSAALALAANPDLHQFVCGGRMYMPHRVDIAIPVSSDGALTPTAIIEGANTKTLLELAAELAPRAEAARAADAKLTKFLRRWGGVLPLGVLRKMVIRLMQRSPKFHRKGAGTFLVSIVPGVDQAMTPVFTGSAILTAGQVAERVLVIGGVPVVRPTVYLACAADHRVWNGNAGARFLRAVQTILEGPALQQEAKKILELKPAEPRAAYSTGSG